MAWISRSATITDSSSRPICGSRCWIGPFARIRVLPVRCRAASRRTFCRLRPSSKIRWAAPGRRAINYGVLPPGNILVTNSPDRRSGEAVRVHAVWPVGSGARIPAPDSEAGGARDLVTDALGNVQIFNGTLHPVDDVRVRSRRICAGRNQFAGWSTADMPTGVAWRRTGTTSMPRTPRRNPTRWAAWHRA